MILEILDPQIDIFALLAYFLFEQIFYPLSEFLSK